MQVLNCLASFVEFALKVTKLEAVIAKHVDLLSVPL